MKFKPPSAKWPGPYGKSGNGKGRVDDEMGSGNGNGKAPRPPTSPPPLWLQEEAWQGRGEHSLMRQELEKANQTQQEDMNMLKTSFDNAWDEQASTRASTKGCGKGPPQRVRRGGLDEKASTKSSDQEIRPLATVREELVGTVGGSGTRSATRVASWIRHVATACAKGIAKTNTYSPIFLYDYYYD